MMPLFIFRLHATGKKTVVDNLTAKNLSFDFETFYSIFKGPLRNTAIKWKGFIIYLGMHKKMFYVLIKSNDFYFYVIMHLEFNIEEEILCCCLFFKLAYFTGFEILMCETQYFRVSNNPY